MPAKTQHTESSKYGEEYLPVRGRRVEDELRLRELELQTNFQIQTLTEALNLLKIDFHSWRDSLNEKLTKVSNEVYSLKLRLTVIIALILGQIAGFPEALSRIIGGH